MFLGILNASLSRFYGGRGRGGSGWDARKPSKHMHREDLWQLPPSGTGGPERRPPPSRPHRDRRPRAPALPQQTTPGRVLPSSLVPTPGLRLQTCLYRVGKAIFQPTQLLDINSR